MNVHDEDDFIFVSLLGAYIRSLRQQECHNSCRGDWSVLGRKAEGAGGGQEDQGQCGCGHGCPKKDDIIWGTIQHL